MEATVKPDTSVAVPARDNGLTTTPKTGAATPLPSSTAPNGGKASGTWWDHIKALDHYDPTYPYDPGTSTVPTGPTTTPTARTG